VDYLLRGIFLIIVSLAWILYEQGTITSLLQVVGSVLIMYGISIVIVSLATLNSRREVVS
jgi:hypothetical protein